MRWKVVFYNHEGTTKEVELANEYETIEAASTEAEAVIDLEFCDDTSGAEDALLMSVAPSQPLRQILLRS